MPLEIPVLIVGGGPVGLVLSMELAAKGVKSLLVNERETTTTHPKGSTINSRTMEHLRRLGAAPAVRETGLPADYPTDSIYVTSLTGWELGRIPMPSLNQKIGNPGPWGETLLTPEPIHRSNQMYFEAAFRRHAEAYDDAELRFGWRLSAFEEGGGRVSAEIEDVATGERERIDAQYLVGCDGANSLVRRSLGINYAGRSSSGDRFYDGTMASIYVRAPGVYDQLAMPRGWHYWTINDQGRSDCITLDGKGEFVILAEVDPATPFADIDISGIFRTTAGADIEVEIISVQEWLAGLALVADHYQKGRVFLAGDSVHLFTPSGGFGFNTGIDDAANLGWKLAATVQGWGGAGLLAAYEAERRPIGIRNTTVSGQYAHKIGALDFPPNLDADSAEGEAARASMRDELATFKEEFASLGIQLGARYDGSALIVADGTRPPPDDPAVYVPSACPGGRAPHYWLEDGGSLYDLFGPWFTLLRLGPAPADAGEMARAARAQNIPLAIVDIQEDGARALYQAGLALIRPDQHVAWRGDALPGDVGGLLAKVSGN